MPGTQAAAPFEIVRIEKAVTTRPSAANSTLRLETHLHVHLQERRNQACSERWKRSTALHEDNPSRLLGRYHGPTPSCRPRKPPFATDAVSQGRRTSGLPADAFQDLANDPIAFPNSVLVASTAALKSCLAMTFPLPFTQSLARHDPSRRQSSFAEDFHCNQNDAPGNSTRVCW